ncbi:unnamed protein product, partial [marine sediment metagenome]
NVYTMGQAGYHGDHAHIGTPNARTIPPKRKAQGGGIGGAGRGDKIPILAEPGEHMLTRQDVDALGGQAAVYMMRNQLQGYQTGGGILDWFNFTQNPSPKPPPPPSPSSIVGPAAAPPQAPAPAPAPAPGSGAPLFGPAAAPPPAPPAGPSVGGPTVNLDAPARDLSATDLAGEHQPGRPPGPPRPPGTPGGPAGTGAPEEQADLAGWIPTPLKANTVAGESNLSNMIMHGSEVVNAIIDQGA